MKGMINFLKATNFIVIFMYAIWASYFIFSGRQPETLDKVMIFMLVFNRITKAIDENKYLDAFEEVTKEGDTKDE